tara:strand:+ start:84 stop:719 length:636 start_codon:yes stop_codon:yes gene_type:complete
MSAIDNINKSFSFIVTIIPVLIPTIAILTSIFENSAKGYLFVLGIFMCLFLIKMTIISFNWNNRDKRQHDTINKSLQCNIFGEEKIGKFVPDTHVFILAFTLLYICVCPMINNGKNDSSFILYSFLPCLLLLLITCIFRINLLCCSTRREVIIGGLIGAILGALWWVIIGSIGNYNRNLTYFEKINDKPCVRINDGTVFKCKSKTKAPVKA